MITSIIVAADLNNGIGVDNQLLCHLPTDLKYFKQVTTGHCIVMGRKTYESIGRPLPNRTNIVITRNVALQIDGCVVVDSVKSAIEYARNQGEQELMITGGGSIYMEAINWVDRVYITRIQYQFNADTFFPDISADKFELVKSEAHQPDEKNKFPYTFEVWERIK